MKKIVSLLLMLALTLSMMTAASAETYTASAFGFAGDVTVTLTIEGDKLVDVKAEGPEETVGVGTRALEQIPAAMLAANSVEVDGVSGATLTGTALMTAAADALAQSGVTLTSVEVVKDVIVYEDTQTDIVIVGAGIAGISAAITAKDAGLDVIVLDKTEAAGGAAVIAAGAVWAIGAEPTKEKYDFTVDEIYEFFNVKSGPVYNKDVFYNLANESTNSYQFMLDNGVTFPQVFQCNPQADPRFWGMFSEGSGAGMMSALVSAMNERDVDLRLKNEVVALNQAEDGSVTGVQVKAESGTYTITADKVILATGGFGQNPEMMAQYVPGYDRINVNQTYVGATGDGHKMVVELGGQLIGEGSMGSAKVLNTRGPMFNPVTCGQPLIMNIKAEQVAASNEHYTKVYSLCMEAEGGMLYMLYPSNIADYTQLTIEALEEMIGSGGGWKADTIEDLAAQIGMDPQALRATVDAHNQLVKDGATDAFGTPAESMIPIEQGPFYMLNRVPGCIGTITGVVVDGAMRVLGAEQKPIENLYAVGEMIYGNWFNQGYPMSGTGLGGCVSSARLAVMDILNAGK